MKIYRVYQHYHKGDKSGTIELGIFSNKKRAIKLLKEIQKDLFKDLGKKNVKLKGDYLWYIEPGEKIGEIVNIKEYELDKEIFMVCRAWGKIGE